MNRRGFLAALPALAAAIAAVEAKPRRWYRHPNYNAYLSDDGRWAPDVHVITAQSLRDVPLNRTLDELSTRGWKPLSYRGKQWWWHQ